MLQNTQRPAPEDSPFSSPAAQGDVERLPSVSASAAAAVPRHSALATPGMVRGGSQHGWKWDKSTARRLSGAGAGDPDGRGIWVRTGWWLAGGAGLWSSGTVAWEGEEVEEDKWKEWEDEMREGYAVVDSGGH